ncbi:MAG: amidase [Betaproteobacteria bacterium]
MKLNLLSAVVLSRQLARREIRAEDVVRDCLERIEARESEVGAWTFLAADAALKQARALDAGVLRGPLHGLPLGIKDLIDTADMPTAYGSSIYAGHQPAWDAACVASARSAGAVILGKTVTTEFATYHPGKTANPHHREHTPGGSSSGSAAAVADFMVPLAYGTQTAGSVIRPAAYCGVVGFKPSFGMIPRAGVKSLAESLDTIGVFGREVEDVALFGGVLAGRRWEIAAEMPAIRVGLCQTTEWESALPETRELFAASGRRLSMAGWSVSDLTLPAEFADLAAVQTRTMAYEVAQSFAWELGAHGAELSPELQRLIGEGLAQEANARDADLRSTRAASALLASVFSGVDVILAPSTPGEAPRGLTATGNPVFNRIWTLLGVPCVHLPLTTGPHGLPLGLQLIARPGTDGALLNHAAQALRLLRE